MKQQTVPIHTEYIQIDQLLKLEGVIETGGQGLDVEFIVTKEEA